MRLILLNSVIGLVVFCAWYVGLFSAWLLLDSYEIIMLFSLVAYSAIGFWAALTKKWSIVEHVANSVPMYALAMTGLGMTLVVATMNSVDDSSLATVFKSVVLSITPNILGVVLMAWLNEILFWCKPDEET